MNYNAPDHSTIMTKIQIDSCRTFEAVKNCNLFPNLAHCVLQFEVKKRKQYYSTTQVIYLMTSVLFQQFFVQMPSFYVKRQLSAACSFQLLILCNKDMQFFFVKKYLYLVPQKTNKKNQIQKCNLFQCCVIFKKKWFRKTIHIVNYGMEHLPKFFTEPV